MYALSLLRVDSLIDVNDSKWQRMQVIVGDCKWTQLIASEHKVNASVCKWLHVNATEQGLIACENKWRRPDCMWIQVNNAWLQVNASEQDRNRKWTGPFGLKLASNNSSMDIDLGLTNKVSDWFWKWKVLQMIEEGRSVLVI